MKKILLSLMLTFGFLSCAYADAQQQALSEAKKVLNAFIVIAENAQHHSKDNKKYGQNYDDKSIQAVIDMSLDKKMKPKRASVMLSNLRSHINPEIAKKFSQQRYKGMLDLGKNVQIHHIRNNQNTGGIVVRYTYFNWEAKGWKVPKEIRNSAGKIPVSPRSLGMIAREINGQIKWFI